jgi:hypothetical protein
LSASLSKLLFLPHIYWFKSNFSHLFFNCCREQKLSIYYTKQIGTVLLYDVPNRDILQIYVKNIIYVRFLIFLIAETSQISFFFILRKILYARISACFCSSKCPVAYKLSRASLLSYYGRSTIDIDFLDNTVSNAYTVKSRYWDHFGVLIKVLLSSRS